MNEKLGVALTPLLSTLQDIAGTKSTESNMARGVIGKDTKEKIVEKKRLSTKQQKDAKQLDAKRKDSKKVRICDALHHNASVGSQPTSWSYRNVTCSLTHTTCDVRSPHHVRRGPSKPRPAKKSEKNQKGRANNVEMWTLGLKRYAISQIVWRVGITRVRILS